jgi:hypothetical protein
MEVEMTVFDAVALSSLTFAADAAVYQFDTRSGRPVRTIDDSVFQLATATCVILLLLAALDLSA